MTHFPTIVTPRTDFPRVGRVFLSYRTSFSRKYRPVGQSFLGKCVPQTHFPADRFSYDTGTIHSRLTDYLLEIYLQTKSKASYKIKSQKYQTTETDYPVAIPK